MTTLLGRLAALVIARPRSVILIAVISCLGLGSVALTVPIDLSFAGVLEGDDPAFRYLSRVNIRPIAGARR